MKDWFKLYTTRNYAEANIIKGMLEENNIEIPLVQTSGNEKGVNLLTCHGSKGLEFEYVFFMGCHF